jgi:hypothetical protein
MPVILAALEPPTDLSTWVGALILTTGGGALVTGLLTHFSKSGDKVDAVTAAAVTAKTSAEAEWKAELRADLKRLIEVQNQLVTGQGLQSKDIASLSARQDQIEKRQEMQAQAHLREVDALRAERRAAEPSRPTRGK